MEATDSAHQILFFYCSTPCRTLWRGNAPISVLNSCHRSSVCTGSHTRYRTTATGKNTSQRTGWLYDDSHYRILASPDYTEHRRRRVGTSKAMKTPIGRLRVPAGIWRLPRHQRWEAPSYGGFLQPQCLRNVFVLHYRSNRREKEKVSQTLMVVTAGAFAACS